MDVHSGTVDHPSNGAPPFAWAVTTDTGLRRDSNEDSYCARHDLSLFVVADGMGGHVAGEVASRVTVGAIEGFVAQTTGLSKDDTWPFPVEPSLSLDANRLRAGIRMANRQLADAQAKASDLRGMATTAASLLLNDAGASIAHVGDSRVYLLRAGALQRLTEDHSWVEEQVRSGALTASAARRHPWRNVVTRALSGGQDPEIDTREEALQSGDRLLLCTDGLSGVVTDAVIAELLGADGGLDGICERLVEEANGAGGPDNVTVLIVEIHAP